jgi:diguanylate cyclase (GGDEF)-like protein/PAS domain S-box-containing protein
MVSRPPAPPAVLLRAERPQMTSSRFPSFLDRGSEQRFFELLEGMSFLSLILDPQGVVEFCNRALLQTLGYNEAELLGRNWFDFCVPLAQSAGRKKAWVEGIRVGAVAPHAQREVLTRDNRIRMLECDIIPLRDERQGIVGAVAIGTDITETRRASDKLLHDAFHDSLTGLPNRALFMDRLSHRLALEKRRHGTSFSVLFLDIDRFKVINDSLGHVRGDELLCEVARRLESCLRHADTVARLGGDEFTILIEDVPARIEALKVADRLQDALRAPFALSGQEVFSGASIGIAHGNANYLRPEDILRDADTALYRAKAQGRGRWVEFDPSMHDRAVALLQLETDLRRALDRRELLLHYQPVVSLITGRITGGEALIRWMHPERGLVPPAEFVPLAEETGLIVAIGAWVLREACQTLCAWQEELGMPALEIGVNVSSKQFMQPGLLGQIASVLRDTHISPRCLRLEVTESLLMDKEPHVADTMTELRAMGVRIDLDDFGTGYSSLSYLHQYPIDSLKVDRSFVSRIGSGRGSNDGLQIVQTILALARSLDMEVVAEGVETDEQLLRLREMRCAYAQGHYLSPPVDPDGFLELLRSGRTWTAAGL